MLLTEEQAKTKWCPQSFNVVQVETGNGLREGGPWVCAGAECMAWRWADPTPPHREGLLSSSGERIRLVREKRGWTQLQLAQMCGSTQQTINRIERGVTVHSRAIPAAEEALGIDRKVDNQSYADVKRLLLGFCGLGGRVE